MTWYNVPQKSRNPPRNTVVHTTASFYNINDPGGFILLSLYLSSLSTPYTIEEETIYYLFVFDKQTKRNISAASTSSISTTSSPINNAIITFNIMDS